MILAAIVIARNPAQYGFDFEPERRSDVREGHAAAAGRPAARRRVDRHDHRRDSGAQPRAAPLDDAGQGHAVRAEGAGRHGRRSCRARLADAPAADLASLKWYTVKRGETLPGIARKLHVSKTDLAEANYLTGHRARRRRPEADGAARSDGADGGADRPAGAGRRVADDGRRRPASSRSAAANSNRVKVDLRGEAGRHARRRSPASSRRPSRRSRPGIRGFPAIA